MRILAIDPGSEHTGYVWCDYTEGKPLVYVTGGDMDNVGLLSKIKHNWAKFDALIIECPRPIGQTVPTQVFEALIWVGRIVQEWQSCSPAPYTFIFRMDVKLNLLGKNRGTDAQVNAALKERFPATGGGSDPVKGTKAQPGPLHGISKHQWPALAAAVTWTDLGMPIIQNITYKGENRGRSE